MARYYEISVSDVLLHKPSMIELWAHQHLEGGQSPPVLADSFVTRLPLIWAPFTIAGVGHIIISRELGVFHVA